MIITSKFHIARTKEIFQWVFGCAPNTRSYTLGFLATEDTGLTTEALAARREREAKSLENVMQLRKRYRSLAEVHNWLTTDHKLYAVQGAVEEESKDDEEVPEAMRLSYGLEGNHT